MQRRELTKQFSSGHQSLSRASADPGGDVPPELPGSAATTISRCAGLQWGMATCRRLGEQLRMGVTPSAAGCVRAHAATAQVGCTWWLPEFAISTGLQGTKLWVGGWRVQ